MVNSARPHTGFYIALFLFLFFFVFGFGFVTFVSRGISKIATQHIGLQVG